MDHDLRRFAEASARLDADPSLHEAWATSADRAIRRALMRSPALPPGVAATIVGVRRSGMHTLGNNPVVPIELLADNPSALRRRQRIDAVLADPTPEALVALGSGTIDLQLARDPALDEATAVLLAGRTDPPIDPWVLAVLADRCEAAWSAAAAHASADRRTIARALRTGA